MPPFNNILFLDIETVPEFPNYDAVPDMAKELWKKKTETLRRDKEFDTPETLYDRAGIYAEFGKIVCVSMGIISGTGDEKKLSLKSFCCDEEKVILNDFSELL